MYKNSRKVTSPQDETHPDLIKVLDTHLSSKYQKPIPEESRKLFERALPSIENFQDKIIIDAGCGTGMATAQLAKMEPDALIIGVDKSSHRLAKAIKACHNLNNVKIFECRLEDFWKLSEQYSLSFHKQYVLYPNPWPKKSQLRSRWHGHPVFHSLISLSPSIEVRSNWAIYLDEFLAAAKHIAELEYSMETISKSSSLTAFEKKYNESGQDLFRLNIEVKRVTCETK